MSRTFPDNEDRYRRQQRVSAMREETGVRYVNYQGPPDLSRSKRAVLSGRFKPTTWHKIFAEITFCKSCAISYPSPGCLNCEKSMHDMDVPSGYVPKVKTVQTFTHDDPALVEQMREAFKNTIFTPPIKRPRGWWSRLILRLRWWR